MSINQLPLYQRYEMIFLSEHSKGPRLGNKKVASFIRCDAKTVRYWRARWKETKDLSNESKSGRPRSTTVAEDEMILNELEENENPTSETINRGLKRKKVKISSRTVQRRLKEAGYRFSAPLSKPLLTTTHKKRRLEWALSMQNKDWDQIIFSDECTIRLGPIKRWRWQLKGSRKVFRTVKHPGKINVWGCFTRHGFGQIVCFKQNLTSKFLCEQIYAKALRRSIRELFGRDPDFQLLEDNDPKHRSNASKEWKRENGIHYLPWPSASPDINPVENLWNILKIRVATKKPKNVPNLIRLIKQEWKKLPLKFCENLVESMQNRIDAVISADGDYTMY
jgi:transposase